LWRLWYSLRIGGNVAKSAGIHDDILQSNYPAGFSAG
jgi:hypothetical protein